MPSIPGVGAESIPGLFCSEPAMPVGAGVGAVTQGVCIQRPGVAAAKGVEAAYHRQPEIRK